jgi:uncharacterized membrane protein
VLADWPPAPGSADGTGRHDPSPVAVLVPSVVTAGTLLVAFGLLALGVEGFWLAFVVGFGVVLPASLTALKVRRSRRDRTATDAGHGEAPLAELQRRYVRGELSEAEFERRVDRLLETASVAETRPAVDDGPSDRLPAEERSDP